MCMTLHPPPPPGHGRSVRKRVRWGRLHRFATDRFLAARAPGAARFWLSVMRRCTVSEIAYEPERRP